MKLLKKVLKCFFRTMMFCPDYIIIICVNHEYCIWNTLFRFCSSLSYRNFTLPPSDQQHNGSLFTMFLHSPLTAFCYCCNLTSIPIHHWERCQSFIDRFVTEASRLFTRSRVGEYDEGMFVDVE